MKKCQCCGNNIPTSIIINGIRKRIKGRKLCLDCSPYGAHNTKPNPRAEYRNCVICGKEISTRRKKCVVCQVRLRRLRLKIKAIEYLGGKCQKCGWQGHIAGFTFHHINPEEKEFEIKDFNKHSWNKVQTELDKCVLLCLICHGIEHSNQNDPKLWEQLDEYKGAKLPKYLSETKNAVVLHSGVC